VLTYRRQLLESELKTKIVQLTEQNNELKRKWEHMSESSRQLRTSDQPAFMSSPAYKSLMASVCLGANSGQVRAPLSCKLTYAHFIQHTVV